MIAVGSGWGCVFVYTASDDGETHLARYILPLLAVVESGGKQYPLVSDLNGYISRADKLPGFKGVYHAMWPLPPHLQGLPSGLPPFPTAADDTKPKQDPSWFSPETQDTP